MRKCLALACEYKTRGVSPPAHSIKLKIIYGSKISKTADLGIFRSIFHIHKYYVYDMRLLSKGEGGECPPLPPLLNETLTGRFDMSYVYKISYW